jgi:hypothetical protein
MKAPRRVSREFASGCFAVERAEENLAEDAFQVGLPGVPGQIYHSVGPHFPAIVGQRVIKRGLKAQLKNSMKVFTNQQDW